MNGPAPDNNREGIPAVREAVAKGDMDALYKALTVRQRRFCEEYVIDYDGTAASIRAGYSPKWADRQAHLLLKHEGIATYIDHLTRSKEAKIVSVNPDYVIQKVLTGIDKAENNNNLTAFFRGLELLARHLGMLTDKTEITGKDGGAIQTQVIQQEAENFTNLLKQLALRAEKEPSPKVLTKERE